MDYSNILSKPKSFFGKQKVWMAHGEDLVLFNTYRPNIQNLLRHSCIPESCHSLWIGLYRIGTAEDEAKTFVVVSCSDRRIRKLTRDLLSSCPIFQPGEALDRFKVISKATLPETACEPQQTMQDESEMPSETGLLKMDKDDNLATEGLKTIRTYPNMTGENHLCRYVEVSQWSEKGELLSQRATAGPLLWLNGCSYQLTVAHVATFKNKKTADTIERNPHDWDDWDDWDEEDEDVNATACPLDENIASWNISTRHNMTPEASNDDGTEDDNSESLSSDSVLGDTIQQDDSSIALIEATPVNKEYIDNSAPLYSSPPLPPSEPPVLEDFYIEHYSSSSVILQASIQPCQNSSEMDYLLIPTKVNAQTEACTSESAELLQISEAFDVQGQTEPRAIIIATASLGYIEGVVFPAPSLLRSPGMKNFETLYCIESNNAMPKGSSGSAVFDKQTGLLAGHIVLGCTEKNFWYMVPIVNVLNDLELRFHHKWKCQIQLNADAAISPNDQKDLFDIKFFSQSRPLESSQNSLLMQRNHEYHQEVVSKLPRATKWGIISNPMTTIVNVLERESQFSARDQPETLICYDQWDSQFGPGAGSPDSEIILVARFRTLEHALLEAMAFMTLHPETPPKEYETKRIRRSRDVETERTGLSGAIKAYQHNKTDGQQPTAWVFDIFEPFNKGSALDSRELLELLHGKSLSPNPHDHTAYTPHYIYIKNTDPLRAMELYRTTLGSQIKGFKDLLFNYISKQPIPMINLTNITGLGSPQFSIAINLPFFVIISHDEFNKRSLAGGASFRYAFSLSFLHIQEQLCETLDENTDPQPGKGFLYSATWSTIVTGTNERYWTAACLDETFDEEKTGNDHSEDTILLTGSSDGQTADIKRLISPRVYALEALAMQLEKIADYHHRIMSVLRFHFDIFEETINSPPTEWFHKHHGWRAEFFNVLAHVLDTNSKIIERLENFLSTELQHYPDGTGGHPLWRGFFGDPGPSESSRRIKKSLDALRDTQVQLNLIDDRIMVRMISLTYGAPTRSELS
ncbi:hypothetical protein FoTM2_002902 [Fusarium oxysporum f. sp. vasinfectum]|uniref:Uncharacterized protein n=1 Tax=Fusarium oxysporum f. sp. vasinfectum 25433 TaxID=1089449 RepID=X0L2T4_FUSOX|nr:hypothetical protein FOTG_11814 [Fusarium oxysporum f. sp. vasinfectum 25433]KAK2939683.1 hypothetical protein FoTM2_002902 [Fusarium oxysporum f. sp. vasinfectum]